MTADWRYEPLSDLDKPLALSLRAFPREAHMWVYGARTLAAFAVRGWLRLAHGFTVTGREHLPAAESFLLVANHASHWDTLCLLSALSLRRLHSAFPAAAADYFFTDLPRSLASVVLVNALPFDRKRHGRESLALCRQVLETPGQTLLLFPEGTRSIDGAIHDFKPGIGLLVAGTSFPVVPCHLQGAYESWPRHHVLPRRGPLTLRIGAPRRYADRPATKESALAIAHELQQAVIELGAE